VYFTVTKSQKHTASLPDSSQKPFLILYRLFK